MKLYSLENFFANSPHKNSIFTQDEIKFIEEKIYTKLIKGKETPYIKCAIRNKEIKLTPEETVRQLFIYRLINSYGYNPAQIKLEHPIHFGREVKKADIVIFEESRPTVEYIIVEVKKFKLSEGKEQLKSYCNATGAPVSVWTNGEKISFYQRKDPNYFEDIPALPRRDQKLKDILRERWTIDDLIAKDKLLTEHKTLSNLIEEMEDEVLANAGVDVFEEVFKLIYTKLYDEMMSGRDRKRFLEFRNYGDTDADLKIVIQNLFDSAKKKWQGVFHDDDKIKLTPSHLAICISSLQNVKLFNSNLDVIDDAFEYLMSKSQKGEKGQFFTPRYVIDMCVKMLNPQPSETMIDTAAGSCGFPVHTIFYVWKNILLEKGIKQSHLFTAEKKPPECEDYVNEKVFAIDFDEKAVRVARTLNLIAGDGKTNVLHLNTLDYERWDEVIDEDWIDIYNEGWKKLRHLRAAAKNNRDFNFDIVMANPPFAGDIKESRVIAKYELGKKPNGKYQAKVGRDILFIERNLQFLKPGGRMAIVLPQGRFNNSSDKFIRDFIAERCRILAVVGLHGNVFKPHTGTKTSVLFVQKWDDKLCPRKDDYPIFFATMTKPSKDNSGEKIYLLSDKPHEFFLKDDNGHVIVDHDLFNHDGLTKDGIAEAFIEFAKKENLSFFDSSSFDESKYISLLEELEITEILFSKLNSYHRLESEYYNAKNFSYVKFLEGKDIISSVQYGTSKLCDENKIGGYPVLRLNELNNGFIGVPQKFCHILTHAEFENLKLKKGDVVIIRTNGNPNLVGRSAVVMEDTNFAFASYLYRIKTNHLINPETLMIFLNSYYGRIEIDKNSMKGNQTNFSPAKFQDLRIPLLTKNFQEKIAEIVKSAHEKLNLADEKYKTAEKILSTELGLENFAPSTENISVKNFSESFGATGRLDAEFYQPKYDDIEKIIKNFDYRKLKNLCLLINHGMQPPYIENGTMRVFSQKWINDKCIDYNFIDDINEPRTSQDFADKNSDYVCRKNDIVHYSVGANIGYCHTYLSDVPMMPGSFITLIRADEKKINPVYLGFILNSIIGRTQSEKNKSGTAQPYVYPKDLREFLIPILPLEVQEKISAQVEESFRLRDESKKLLELAKESVELAIEEGEEAALKLFEIN